MTTGNPRVRATDPLTSSEAAARHGNERITFYGNLIQALATSETALTQHEIAHQYTRTWPGDTRKHDTIRRRVSDLERYGWITTTRRVTYEGTSHQAYETTTLGRSVMTHTLDRHSWTNLADAPADRIYTSGQR